MKQDRPLLVPRIYALLAKPWFTRLFGTYAGDDEDPEMVEWGHEHASRSGIGQIHLEASEMLGPEEKKIILG